jgi:Tol biopolymer transport system component
MLHHTKTSAMKKNLFGLFLLSLATFHLQAQDHTLGIFDDQTDVGSVALKGSCKYNPQTQEYTIVGSGQNIWADHDDFHFVWKKMKGDFLLRTNAAFVGAGVEQHRKWGWMIRASLDSSSAHANAVVHGDGLTSLQFRKTRGDTTGEKRSTLTKAYVVELERRGTTIIMRVARNGETFTMDSIDLDLGDEVYAGLFVCSHNAGVSETVVFHNVRVVIPAPPTLVPYRQYLGSQLEILDVATGKSRIVFQSPRSIQAPNYLHDGKHLIYNSEGLIYQFDLGTVTPVVLNTGSVKHNNNDHVISWDGKMLGLSSSETDNGPSLVWTVPITGGEPRKITPTGPSYLHGWSTDNKALVFVGQRNNEFDIYKISANGGDETRLTNTPGLDDGCEYSPDGKYIYFNSVRSGSMQIYRMKPDGSDQEQLTSDEWNNWFPHVSPDGKWVVFISFGKDVSPSDHPFYKHVYLRLMPAGGGNPKVIAYLYGGQGTINTPSWSPDSKQVAFISNSNFLAAVYPTEKR